MCVCFMRARVYRSEVNLSVSSQELPFLDIVSLGVHRSGQLDWRESIMDPLFFSSLAPIPPFLPMYMGAGLELTLY